MAAIALVAAILLARRCSPRRGGRRARPLSACLASSAHPRHRRRRRAGQSRRRLSVSRATLLPALELRDGVPGASAHARRRADLADDAEAVEEQIERLEIHHLASPEGDLHFALLSDWTDTETEHAEGDEALLAAAAEGDRPSQSALWPGARRPALSAAASPAHLERKRRALDRLGAQARQAARTEPAAARRDRHHVHRRRRRAALAPTDIRYVVTLDADTRLPRDTVRRLIGKMAHPLNRPRFDAVAGRVVEGYAVLQPRVTPSLPMGREGSLFQRIFSSLSGIDPYASAVSDVYQDLFGEGSYAGKGIYDVDAFEAALAGRGRIRRCSATTCSRACSRAPVSLRMSRSSRNFPPATTSPRSAITVGRAAIGNCCHGSSVVRPARDRQPPAVGRWKMLDNLRRTLSAPAAVLALLAGWTLPFHAALIWSLFVVLTIVLPTLIPVVAAIPPRRPGVTIASHLRALGGDFRLALTLSTLTVAFLADQAWLMADAIGRTLWRLGVTRRHLSSGFRRRRRRSVPALTSWACAPNGGGDRYRRHRGDCRVDVRPGNVVGGAAVRRAVGRLAGGRAAHQPVPRAAADCRCPTPTPRRSEEPRAAPGGSSRHSSRRRTTCCRPTIPGQPGAGDRPSDVADQSRPVSAFGGQRARFRLDWDRGAIDRIEATLATMSGLQRFRGHFYNWYDTRDLRPLDPRYVSSVDSGNLAGHLIALANACREWKTRPLADRSAPRRRRRRARNHSRANTAICATAAKPRP